jgi:hypothetical protein
VIDDALWAGEQLLELLGLPQRMAYDAVGVENGREILERLGMSENEEGLDAGDVAGFGVDMALDPWNLILPGLGLAGGALGGMKAAKYLNRAKGLGGQIDELPDFLKLMRQEDASSALAGLSDDGARAAAFNGGPIVNYDGYQSFRDGNMLINPWDEQPTATGQFQKFLDGPEPNLTQQAMRDNPENTLKLIDELKAAAGVPSQPSPDDILDILRGRGGGPTNNMGWGDDLGPPPPGPHTPADHINLHQVPEAKDLDFLQSQIDNLDDIPDLDDWVDIKADLEDIAVGYFGSKGPDKKRAAEMLDHLKEMLWRTHPEIFQNNARNMPDILRRRAFKDGLGGPGAQPPKPPQGPGPGPLPKHPMQTPDDILKRINDPGHAGPIPPHQAPEEILERLQGGGHQFFGDEMIGDPMRGPESQFSPTKDMLPGFTDRPFTDPELDVIKGAGWTKDKSGKMWPRDDTDEERMLIRLLDGKVRSKGYNNDDGIEMARQIDDFNKKSPDSPSYTKDGMWTKHMTEPMFEGDIPPGDNGVELVASEYAKTFGRMYNKGDIAKPDYPLSPKESAKNLKTFMKGSKVVDEKGEPLKVHHGTRAPEFDKFKSHVATEKESRKELDTLLEKYGLSDNSNTSLRDLAHAGATAEDQKKYTDLVRDWSGSSMSLINQKIGTHFAVDPRVTEAFTVGQYARNTTAFGPGKKLIEVKKPGVLTGESYSELLNPGGRTMPIYLNIKKPYPVPDHSAMDQVNIAAEAAGTVFRDDKEMFIKWGMKNRGATRDKAEVAYKRLLANKPVDMIEFRISQKQIDEWDGDALKAIAADYGSEYGPGKVGESWSSRVAEKFKEIIGRQGYDGLEYKNTSYNEVKKGFSAKTYVTFDDSQIKSATGNRGTYDPTNPNILKSLIGAGGVGAGVGANEIMKRLQEQA